MSGAVVVGVSPTTGSPAALKWGAAEAGLRSVPLRAVMAWRNPRAPGVAGTRPPIPAGATGADRAHEAEESLREFVVTALGSVSDVDCSVVHGNEVDALLSEASDAELLVMGEPRPGRLSSMRASLVAPHVVFKARCPVVVIPAASPPVG